MSNRKKTDDEIVSVFQPLGETGVVKVFPSTTASADIVEGALGGCALEAEEVEVMTDVLDRSREFGAGFELSFNLAEGSISFKRTPHQEKRTTTRVTYKVKKRD